MEYNVFEIDSFTLYVIPCSPKLKNTSFRISKKEWNIRERRKKLKKICSKLEI